MIRKGPSYKILTDLELVLRLIHWKRSKGGPHPKPFWRRLETWVERGVKIPWRGSLLSGWLVRKLGWSLGS
jgi:hypothetical protein